MLSFYRLGTHDLLQPRSTGEKIGKSPNFPNHPPLLAIEELFTRYGLTKMKEDFSYPFKSNRNSSIGRHKQRVSTKYGQSQSDDRNYSQPEYSCIRTIYS